MLVFGFGVLIYIVLVLSGASIAFSFMVSVLFMVLTLGYDPIFLLPYGFSQMNCIVLLTIPFFIIAGALMEKGGITRPIINFVNSVVSKIRGGLGAAGIITNVIFGAVSGSSAAAIACIGRILIPHMVEEGYPRGYATALLTSAAGIANLIPPSILLILYGWLSFTSITTCFLAGIIPGLLLTFVFIIINWVMVGGMPTVKKPRPWGSVKQVGKEMVHTGRIAIPGLLMPVVILGSIYSGIATPTEAAALSILYAIPVGFIIYRGLTPKSFATSLLEASTVTGAIMVLLLFAMMIGRVFVMEQIPAQLTAFLLSISDNKYVILLMVNVIVIIFGMLIDDIACIIITVPLLFPIVVTGLGISPVHFSVILTVNILAGCYTPPYAPMLYIGQIIGETTFAEMFKTNLLLVALAYLPVLMLVTYIPALSMWLPELILGPGL